MQTKILYKCTSVSKFMDHNSLVIMEYLWIHPHLSAFALLSHIRKWILKNYIMTKVFMTMLNCIKMKLY